MLYVHREKLIRQRSFENNLRTSFDATLRPDTEDQRTVDTGISTTREESTPRSARAPFGHSRMDLDSRPSSSSFADTMPAELAVISFGNRTCETRLQWEPVCLNLPQFSLGDRQDLIDPQ